MLEISKQPGEAGRELSKAFTETDGFQIQGLPGGNAVSIKHRYDLINALTLISGAMGTESPQVG